MSRDLLLLLWVAAAILLPGLVVSHRWLRLKGSESVAYGAAAGVVIQALLGLALVWTRQARWPVIGLSIALTAGALFYLWRSRAGAELWNELSRGARLALAIWAGFVVGCIAVSHLPVKLPATLSDSRYIYKEPTVPVQIQYLTSLPTDNYIPYVVAEYFLRRLSFRENRPLLPGQEVSNRTVLMSLVTLPFRAACGMPPRAREGLPAFAFVGTQWPNTGTLYREEFYRQFLVVSIFLNSLLLLGLVAVFSRVRDALVLPLGAAFYAMSPYLVAQTIFTWPKALAGFFIVLAWHSMRRGFHPGWAAVCFGLAYHSHPYALVFAAGMGLFYCHRWWRGSVPLRAAVMFAVVFGLLVAPWLLWTKLALQIPSDLVAQNFSAAKIFSAPLDFIWVRVTNSYRVLAPTFLGVYRFHSLPVLDQVLVCLPGAVGLLLVFPGLLAAQQWIRPRALWWLAVVLPCVGLVALFDIPADSLVHGFQAAVGALIFWGVIWLRRRVSPPVFWSIVGTQAAMQLWFLLLRAHTAVSLQP